MVQSGFTDKLYDRHRKPAGRPNKIKQIVPELETLRGNRVFCRTSWDPQGGRPVVVSA